MADGEEAKRLRKEAGAYLQKQRVQAGLSQLDLSRRLGYDYYSFVSQVESGFSRMPPDAMRAWADALGVPLKQFALTLLRYYEPFFFDAIFAGDSAEAEARK